MSHRVPDHVKVARGTFRRDRAEHPENYRRSGREKTPSAPRAIPKMPPGLSEEAAGIWAETAPLVARNGLFDVITALRTYCELLALLRHGALSQAGANHLRLLAAELGVTPHVPARARRIPEEADE